MEVIARLISTITDEQITYWHTVRQHEAEDEDEDIQMQYSPDSFEIAVQKAIRGEALPMYHWFLANKRLDTIHLVMNFIPYIHQAFAMCLTRTIRNYRPVAEEMSVIHARILQNNRQTDNLDKEKTVCVDEHCEIELAQDKLNRHNYYKSHGASVNPLRIQNALKRRRAALGKKIQMHLRMEKVIDVERDAIVMTRHKLLQRCFKDVVELVEMYNGFVGMHQNAPPESDVRPLLESICGFLRSKMAESQQTPKRNIVARPTSRPVPTKKTEKKTDSEDNTSPDVQKDEDEAQQQSARSGGPRSQILVTQLQHEQEQGVGSSSADTSRKPPLPQSITQFLSEKEKNKNPHEKAHDVDMRTPEPLSSSPPQLIPGNIKSEPQLGRNVNMINDVNAASHQQTLIMSTPRRPRGPANKFIMDIDLMQPFKPANRIKKGNTPTSTTTSNPAQDYGQFSDDEMVHSTPVMNQDQSQQVMQTPVMTKMMPNPHTFDPGLLTPSPQVYSKDDNTPSWLQTPQLHRTVQRLRMRKPYEMKSPSERLQQHLLKKRTPLPARHPVEQQVQQSPQMMVPGQPVQFFSLQQPIQPTQGAPPSLPLQQAQQAFMPSSHTGLLPQPNTKSANDLHIIQQQAASSSYSDNVTNSPLIQNQTPIVNKHLSDKLQSISSNAFGESLLQHELMQEEVHASETGAGSNKERAGKDEKAQDPGENTYNLEKNEEEEPEEEVNSDEYSDYDDDEEFDYDDEDEDDDANVDEYPYDDEDNQDINAYHEMIRVQNQQLLGAANQYAMPLPGFPAAASMPANHIMAKHGENHGQGQGRNYGNEQKAHDDGKDGDKEDEDMHDAEEEGKEEGEWNEEDGEWDEDDEVGNNHDDEQPLQQRQQHQQQYIPQQTPHPNYYRHHHHPQYPPIHHLNPLNILNNQPHNSMNPYYPNHNMPHLNYNNGPQYYPQGHPPFPPPGFTHLPSPLNQPHHVVPVQEQIHHQFANLNIGNYQSNPMSMHAPNKHAMEMMMMQQQQQQQQQQANYGYQGLQQNYAPVMPTNVRKEGRRGGK